MTFDVNKVAPRIRERRCGGWLAVSLADAPLKIGVTADTEDQAREAFAQAVREWEVILTSDRSHDESSDFPTLPVTAKSL